MGQEQSMKLRRHTPTRLLMLVEKMNKQANTLKKVATLSYAEFVDTVQILNELMDPFSEHSGKQLIFAVTPGSEEVGYLWRAVIRIKCLKINRQDGKLESCRLLNLHQFIRLNNEIMNQIDVAKSGTPEFNSTNLMDASVLIDHIDQIVAENATDECSGTDECCICMDRKAQILLPCAHNYCEQCIDAWGATSHLCPLCRQKMETTDSSYRKWGH